jgi:hypothetical protein
MILHAVGCGYATQIKRRLAVGTTLRAKIAVLTLALGLVALVPLNCQAEIAKKDAAASAERGTRAGLQPVTVLNWDLSGLFTLLRSGR